MWEAAAGLPVDSLRVEIGFAPSQPSILYAGMWQFRRWPWFFAA